MGEYVETNPEEDSDDECSQETEKEDEIEPIFEGEDDDNPVYVKQKRNSSIKILGRCRKKRKALMEFRRRLEDAIEGKHLFLKTHEYSAGEKGEEDLKEIRLWGVPLLPSKGDEGTDIILMKFLKAQDWKVAGAFEMLRRTLTWRKNQKIDQILEEKLGDHDLAHAVFGEVLTEKATQCVLMRIRRSMTRRCIGERLGRRRISSSF
ncbi:hypothetical protein Nepgr_004180 [Nepenthes gracilis]|uniref:CRAL/TRIO N-terminal domain-containing protein n=1 Tax=Nepenthes gracilis TaxID=150966 RepID=A0AAD3XF04_NEPGR|nr:hypothetical protein Nepgr_004180 [Nepenthes gracilis]